MVFLMMALTVILSITAKLAYEKRCFRLAALAAGIALILVVGLYCEREKESEGTLASEKILPIGSCWEVLGKIPVKDRWRVFLKNLKTGKELGINTEDEFPEKFTVQWNGAWVGRKRIYVPYKENGKKNNYGQCNTCLLGLHVTAFLLDTFQNHRLDLQKSILAGKKEKFALA